MKLTTINRHAFFLLIFLLSMVKSIKTTIDPDFYWYIEDGKYFVEQGKVPRANIYSFLNNKELISYSLGFDIILYKFYKAYGIKHLYILTGFFLTILFSLMIILSYRPQLKLIEFLIIYLGSFLLVFWGTTLRPHLISYIFTLIFFLLYEKKKLHITMLLFPIWSLFHGGVIWGSFLLGVFAIDHFLNKNTSEGINTLFYLIGGALLILIVNPYKFSYFTHLFTTLSSHTHFLSKYISEWQSLPYALIHTRHPYYLVSFTIICIFCILFFTGKKDKRFRDTFLMVFSAIEAVLHVRNIPLFGLVSLWILPRYIDLQPLKIRISFESLNTRFHLFILTFANVFLLFLLINTQKLADPLFDFYPGGAVEYLKIHKAHGRILVPSDRAAFVEYHLYPECKIAVDGRLSASKEELLAFFKFWNMETDPIEYIIKHKINYIIIPQVSKPLIDTLLSYQNIKVVYHDRYFKLLKVEYY